MAAALAAFNNYLNGTLGITENSVRTAINAQGLQGPDDFTGLTDDDIATICENCRKPGGRIANPDAGLAGQPATINNPGVQLSFVTEKRLKMLNFYIHHLGRIQRPFESNRADLNRLIQAWSMKEKEESANDEELELPPKLTDVKHVRSVIEDLDNHLTRKLGQSRLPLMYVVRDNVALPAAADDPGYRQPDLTTEMIGRGSHTAAAYQADNITVWGIIRHVTHGGPGWSWVSKYARSSNGRDAYIALKGHYFGEAYASRIRAQADQVLENAFFDGRSRTFTFENYCETLIKAFNDIEDTNETVTEERKMRVFMKGLTDPRCEAVKGTIRATRTLRTNLADSMDMVAEMLGEMASFNNPARRNVSNSGSSRAFNRSNNNHTNNQGRGTGRGGGGRGRGRGRGGRGRGSSQMFRDDEIVLDRYYTDHDWWNRMTEEQRTRLRNMRQNRAAQGNQSGGNGRRNVHFAATGNAEDSGTRHDSNADNGNSTRNVSQRTENTNNPTSRDTASVATARDGRHRV